MMRPRVLVLAVVLTLVACSGTQATEASETTGATAAPSDIAAHSQGVLEAVVTEGQPGCSAAVGRDGTVVWAGARGIADISTGAEITPDTVFDIGSVSKQFTATAILLLAGAGKLALDDELSRYVPGLPGWADTVTISQLMHQTSGIPDYLGLLEGEGYQFSDRTTQAQALQALTTVTTLGFQPGTRFEYSNSNYLLLGEIVQRVSGEPLPEFLNANIFQPLDLAIVMEPVGTIPGKALSYQQAAAGYDVADSAWEQIGDGAIQTTPSQLVRWADNYRTGKVGGRQLLDAQLTGAVETEPGGDRYAAGIYVLADGMLDHDGAWAGFVTAFRISKDRRTSLAISCNASDKDPEAMADKLGQLWM